MARNRTPKLKAEVAGRTLHDPQRFRDRPDFKQARPIGEPYANMTETEKAAWVELASEMPWLKSSHRVILRLACILIAKMDDATLGVSASHALSSVLSKLGGTPVDESKVNYPDDEDDPTEQFFNRTH